MNEASVRDQIVAAGVDYVTTLPCDRIKGLIPLVRDSVFSVDLTREEVGVGLCAGAALAGARPAMLIQSTGAATLLNALLSLTVYYGLPLPMLISWRGHYREGIAAQIPLGERLCGLFAAAGIETVTVEEPGEIHRVGEGIRRAFSASAPVAVLMSPKIFEPVDTPPPSPAAAGRGEGPAPSRHGGGGRRLAAARGVLTRFEALEVLAPFLEGAAVVVNIGVPSKEYHAIADGPGVFYMLGSLGLASAIGLGIARFTEKRVVVIDGDGSLLMTPNVLQHIAEHDRDNLTVVAVDNGAYGSTGNQKTATATAGVDLERLARAYGVRRTARVHTAAGIAALFSKPPLPRFVHLPTVPGNAPAGNIALTGTAVRRRFMEWL